MVWMDGESYKEATQWALAHIIFAKKEVDTTSSAHVLMRLPPTQDQRVGMGAKKINHIGGGVAATNFGAVHGLFGIAYWNRGCLGLLAEIVSHKWLKKDQEKDKIGSKRDKNRKRGEAGEG
nr:hypothetical protein [Tanacetum cinerariifolium]